jgi:hypothetical protein
MGTPEPLHLSEEEMGAARASIQAGFVHLNDTFAITSLPTEAYNCVAWVAGEADRKWWPRDYYWPQTAPRNLSRSAFLAAFSSLGYKQCDNGDLEAGVEKVVLYTRDRKPTHMARQLPDGRWSTKLGDEHDIALTDLGDLTGGSFGRIELYMGRPTQK